MDRVISLRILRTSDPYGLRLVGESDFSNRQCLDDAVRAVLTEQPDPSCPIRIDVEELRYADAAIGMRASAPPFRAGVKARAGRAARARAVF
jgi:hypothetical protein